MKRNDRIIRCTVIFMTVFVVAIGIQTEEETCECVFV